MPPLRRPDLCAEPRGAQLVLPLLPVPPPASWRAAGAARFPARESRRLERRFAPGADVDGRSSRLPRAGGPADLAPFPARLRERSLVRRAAQILLAGRSRPAAAP